MGKAKASKRTSAAKASSVKKSAKAATPPKAPDGSVRGAALVERVIASLEAAGGVLGGCGIPKHRAKGLDAAKLAKLALPDGRPPPPSLARFLAYDESYLGVLVKGKLAFQTFDQMMESEFDAATREMYSFYSSVLDGSCLVLPAGSDSRRFMYCGTPDAHGEYPVFIVDTDELPFVCLAYPGLDVCLADGTVTKIIKGTYTDCLRNKTYKSALLEQARLNFRGFVSISLGDDPEPEEIDGRPALEVLAELFDEGPMADFSRALLG